MLWQKSFDNTLNVFLRDIFQALSKQYTRKYIGQKCITLFDKGLKMENNVWIVIIRRLLCKF